jgi:hypothetical protein
MVASSVALGVLKPRVLRGRVFSRRATASGGFNWSSQHLDEGGGKWRPGRAGEERPGRGEARCPCGTRGWQRDQLERVWRQMARGATTEEAAIAAGGSVPVGARWFREAGGRCPISLAPASGRSLSLTEGEEIAIERARGWGVREIARHLGRSPSTISRELRRKTATRAGSSGYRATVAQSRAPQEARLVHTEKLRAEVEDRRPTVRSRVAPGSPVGKDMEPRAEREAPPARLPRRRDDAPLPQGHLPGTLPPRPWTRASS